MKTIMTRDRRSVSKDVRASFKSVCGLGLLTRVRETQPLIKFHLTNEQFITLAAALNNIVIKYNGKSNIYVLDVESCATVNDCIDLVMEAIEG